jgi:chromosome segregation ATPase
MKTILRITLAGIFLAACPALAVGQEAANAASGTTEKLRTQLADVQAKEAELQTRERQLDEDLRPENIERSLAGVGSTRPEELREQRRRQLESEKTRVRAQLDQLAQSRTRLEAAIATADAESYRRSAQVNYSNSQPQLNPQPQPAPAQAAGKATPAKKQRPRRRRARRH